MSNSQPESVQKSGAEAVACLEAQVAQLKEQLARAQTMTALGELVGTTTHEFNNVLMTIINYAKLGMRHKDDPTRDKAFQKIMAAGQRAAKITNSVLGMARNRKAGFEATDLGKLTEESLILLEREMRKYRVQVTLEFQAAPPILADGNQIQQVLLNLLTNARQAMPQGGRLLVKISHDKDADTVDLLVKDSGQGIPPEQLPHIFDPYFSTKEGPDASGKGGTGLGLASCRDIIEAHRGRVRVQSTVGVGTAFTIKLPVAKKAAAKSGIPAPAARTGAAANPSASVS